MELFLTRAETATTLRLSLRTIDTLICNGELAVRRVGRRVLVPTDEVRRFAKGEGLECPALTGSPAPVVRSDNTM
jgi:excisionase family DNA binding protein